MSDFPKKPKVPFYRRRGDQGPVTMRESIWTARPTFRASGSAPAEPDGSPPDRVQYRPYLYIAGVKTASLA